MLPLSIVFLIGYLFTYNDYVYRGLKTFSLNETGKLDTYLNFATVRYFMLGAFATVAGVLCFSLICQ